MLPRSALLAGIALLAGCSVLPRPEDGVAPAPAPPTAEVLQARQVAGHLLALQTAVQGSESEKAELLNSARAAYEHDRQGSAALRYGLLLAAPGHRQRIPLQAQRLLREALARPELLSAPEQALAVVELARVDQELRLVAEIERLTSELQQERERQRNTQPNAALNKRLQTEIEESARLRKALDEARAKLDAITKIERSFSDRPTAPEGRNQ